VEDRERYFGIDLLRMYAASLVVLNHFGIFAWNTPSMASDPKWVAFPSLVPASWFGWVGVEIFFVISGFVIAASAQHATPMGFVKNRVIRVAPALWICSTLALLVQVASGQALYGMLAAYFRSIFLAPVGPYIDGVIWTLVVEAVFYFLIFMTLLAAKFDRIHFIAGVLGTASAAFLLFFACATYFHDIPVFSTIASICGRFYFKLLLLRYGVFFASGILLWYGFDRGFGRSTLSLITFFVAFCIVEIVIQNIEYNQMILIRSGDQATVEPLLFRSILAVMVWVCGVVSLVISVVFKSKIYHRLKNYKNLLRDVGLLTYPIYLNHFSLGMTLTPALFALGLERPLVLVLSLSAVLGSSWFIMRFLERAFQSALLSFSSRLLKVA
jgi:peptidoglycan/LPS O-acetylase OafA/YrhL